MSFNRDKNKQAQEIVFSRKLSKPKHPKLLFIKVPLVFYSSQKHAAIVLDEKPSFTHHMEVKYGKKILELMLICLNNVLTWQALLTIYKSFIRAHLDYRFIIYDQPNKESLCQTTLKSRRWLCMLHMSKYIQEGNNSYNEWLIEGYLETYHGRTDVLKHSFFPYTISEWNKMDWQIPKVSSFLSFKNAVLKLVQPLGNSYFSIDKPVGSKLLTRLWIQLSHLSENKFKHKISNLINPFCFCSLEVESITYFFLHCFCKSS